MARYYAKHFIPLESNPEVFTALIHNLGCSTSLTFEDVFTLDEPDFLPRPSLALILIFPGGDEYEIQLANENSKQPSSAQDEPGGDVFWFKQTIHNACGLYAILHAVFNGKARTQSGSTLEKLLKESLPLTSKDRPSVLEKSKELEDKYAIAASEGDTEAPESAENEVDHHFICFVKANDGHLYELDGDKNGPVDTGVVLKSDEDVLCESGLTIVREYIRSKGDENIGFGLMALVESSP